MSPPSPEPPNPVTMSSQAAAVESSDDAIDAKFDTSSKFDIGAADRPQSQSQLPSSSEVVATLESDQPTNISQPVSADRLQSPPTHSQNLPADRESQVIGETISSSLPASAPEPSVPSPPVPPVTDQASPVHFSESLENAEIRTGASPKVTEPELAEAVPAVTQPESSFSEPAADQVTESTFSGKVREREDDVAEYAPSPKRPKMDDNTGVTMHVPMNETSSEPKQPEAMSTSPAPVATTSTEHVADTEMKEAPPEQQQADASIATPAATSAEVKVSELQPLIDTSEFGQMTEVQRKRLVEGMRNIKKGKHARAYLQPVDWQAMNLHTYPDVVKQPMDLTTMEQKLKGSEYGSVADYVSDFDLMVQNSIRFNGNQHPVAQAGTMLRSQLTSQLKKLPKAGESAAEEPPKKRKSSGSEPSHEPKRRTSRPSAGTAPSHVDQTPHAPGPDGVPLIRRDSTVGDRPKRKIQKPPPRDLSYPKPAKKKFQAELRFCANVLNEMQRPRYQAYSAPFLTPVDPVALNIPDYFKIIKKPMDVGSIQDKLDSGQYENAKEFESDFRQIFTNCYKFNPDGNAVRLMGNQYEELFNAEWAKKQNWLAEHFPISGPPSPDPESEEEQEEEEDEEDDKDAKIAALHEQLIALQQQTSSLMMSNKNTNKGASKKGTKAAPGKTPQKSKKSSLGGASTAPKPEKKPSKPKQPKAAKPSRPTSQREKQEIANRISELGPEDIEKAATIIKTSLRKAGKHQLAVSIC